mmetsp:Transcript_17278/g.28270  ORF Transcript_17278/g.28270 Transcript_17278/m.28270 type:complete len:679 (+) Transcript_17278:92-2128(+)
MEESSDFDAQNAGMKGGQPRVNSDFYINRDNYLGCNSLSSLSAGNTTLSKFAGGKFGGLEVRHGKYIGDVEVDVGTVDPLPVHLLHPDSEHIEEKNTTEDRSSISSLTTDLPPGMNRRDRSTLFSKNIRQIQRSSRAQFQVEGIRDAFDSHDQIPIDYWGRNNGAQPWYSAQPNQFDQNNNHRMSPSTHEVFVSTPEKDLITSEVHINTLIRSPEPSAHHNSSHLSSNGSPTRTEQNENVGFFAYLYGRYSDYSRNKRIIILLFLIALLGACVGVIAASVGTKKDDSLSNKNDKFASFGDVSYQGSQMSLEEALPKDFIDEAAYLRDGADAINSTDTQSNPPSSSSSSTMKESGKSNMPTPSPFVSSSQTTLAPSRQPSSAPTPMPSSRPSTPPTPVPTPTPSQSPPSRFPTHKLSRQPSHLPTPNPSRRPTHQPSIKPTRRPTPRPTPITLRPSTENPTRRPTVMPSPKPSSPPSKEPSKSPSQKPTTLAPSKTPTLKPSTSPTHKPTTIEPSKAPTLKPSTASPTNEPSWSPSAAPISSSPTSLPSELPTTLPPSSSPSASPTLKPSPSPSVAPTVKPITLEPSRSPSRNPITYEPSSAPSITRTSSPLASPTPGPSILAVSTNPPTPITMTSTAAPATKIPTTSSPVSDDSTDEPSVSVTSLETLIYPTYAPTVA